MEKLNLLNCDEFSEFLEAQGAHEDIVASFSTNRISGEAFLNLSEDDLKELLPVIGDRVYIRGLLRNARETTSTASESHTKSALLPSASKRNPVVVQQVHSSEELSSLNQNWHLEFEIPDLRNFSGIVKEAVSTGVVTGQARREIIQVLRTYMTKHTIHPSSEHYVTVCQKLIMKYPNLQDTEGKSNFGSWRLSLRNAFKNFRKKSANSVTTDERPSKRTKWQVESTSEIDQQAYEEAVENLKAELKKKGKGKHKTIKNIMEATRTIRCQWINEKRPLMAEVLLKFPCLAYSKWMRREFGAVAQFKVNIDVLMRNWEEWCAKIINFSKVESASRPLIKKTLAELESIDKFACPEDSHDYICIELLTRLLFPRGLGKGVYFIKHFQTCDIDVTSEVNEIQQAFPFIVITGVPGEENCQFFICGEKDVLLESKSLKDAIVDLISFYFVFDVVYPKYLNAILLFCQHYVFQLRDNQPIPTQVTKLVTNLKKF